MTTFWVTFGIIVFLVFIMAIGVLFGRKPIRGSCGGYEALGAECAIGCKTPCEKRLARMRAAAEGAVAEDEEDR
ncbi:hypothetical protein AGMMS50289_13900 [Betaproteobacteria bacterium]|nr:hypothetical protein AGMMS50289_13900 [Betaproteobacteria bacterium]